ncbi:MAG: hypothetical protein AAFN74_07160 [Myxococcota bacterium]
MRLIFLLTLGIAVATPWRAEAQATPPPGAPSAPTTTADRAQALYLEGMTLYRAGKYRSAVGRFEKAYRLVPDPRLMYNIGRSYEALGNLSIANRWFLRTVDDPQTTTALRQKATKRIRMIERARQRSAQAPSDAAQLVAPAKDSGVSAMGTTKWLSGVAGLGLLGTGAAFLTLGLLDESELDDARTASGQVSTLTRQEAADLAGRAEDRQLMGTIMLGAGAALAITSVVLFLVDGDDDDEATALFGPSSGRSSERSSERSSFAVSIGPYGDGGGVQLFTAF